MDINSAYEQEVRHCPQARIVYDLFHVAASHSMRSERAGRAPESAGRMKLERAHGNAG